MSVLAVVKLKAHKGKGVAGVFTRDLAETKAQTTMDYAAKHGFPLKVTAEPCD